MASIDYPSMAHAPGEGLAGTIDCKSMPSAAAGRDSASNSNSDSDSESDSDSDSEAIARAFGAAVHALRLQVGISLNELARRARVDPAYVHRIESRAARRRPPLPRRAVVVAIAAALGSDAH